MDKKTSLEQVNRWLSIKNKIKKIIIKPLTIDTANMCFIIFCIYVLFLHFMNNGLFVVFTAISVYFIYQEIKGDIMLLIYNLTHKR